MSEATGTEGQEGGEATEPTVEELQQQLAAEKESNAKLDRSLKAERAEHKATKTKAKESALSEEEQAEFDRLRTEEQERADKEMIPMAEVKEMVIERSHEQIQAAHQERDEANERAKTAEATLDRVVLRNAFHDAASEVEGLQPSAINEFIRDAMLADGNVRFPRDGEAIRLEDEHGNSVLNPDGTANMELKDWIESQRSKFPHRFIPNQGGGPGPGTGGNGLPAGTKKAADMSVADKIAFVKEHGLEAWQKHVGASGST